MTIPGNDELKLPPVRLAYSNEIKGNFIRLPISMVSMLESTSIPIHEFGIAIENGRTVLHVGWDGHESSQSLNGEPAVEINPVLAQEYALMAGDEVTLSIRHYNSSMIATEVYAEPETSDDWEIIESNAQFFQDEMLHQTRVVATGGKLICYVDKIVAKFKIQKVVPAKLNSARITTDTLVIVSPRENKAKLAQKKREVKPLRSFEPLLKRSLFSRDHDSIGFYAEMHSKDIHAPLATVSVIVNPLEEVQDKEGDKSTIHPIKKIAVRVLPNDNISRSHIALSDYVWSALSTSKNNGLKVKVEFIHEQQETDPPTVMVHLVNDYKKDKKIVISGEATDSEQFKKIESFMTLLTDTVLSNKMCLPQLHVFLELLQDNGEQVPFYDWKGQPIDWKLSKDTVTIAGKNAGSMVKKPPSIVGVDRLFNDMLAYLCLPVTSSAGTFLHGLPGMGKTLLLQNLSYELATKYRYHVKIIDCNTLSDSSNFSAMKQKIHKWCSLCYWYSPTLLVLDNADALFPNTKTEEEMPGGNTSNNTSTKLCQVLITELNKIIGKLSSAVRVIMSGKNRDSINQLLFTKHLIGQSWQLSPPSRDERNEILNYLLKSKSLELSPELDIRNISLDTEGYSPQDLSILVDKIFHEQLCSNSEKFEAVVNNDVVQRAMSGFTPSSLRGVKLQKSTGVKWSDIGALKKAKNLLLETLEWPTKYAPIFAKSPLRLRSGILLYGYPGCGKTMLASAVAQQCGLNFISVKGPEILNKYIGASEQSVRELFERAQAAKPCILFFDEFDSIAPKRGHDSTGVTDRVVNQMLTQMDGAEGLDGVYVLAATSRPDLIDSALLRPGRLDKSVLCDIPSAEERLDILISVTQSGKMVLEDDCDLEEVAGNTEGFSGADLQGLCYNAYLKAVHRNLEASVDTGTKESNEVINTPQLDYIALNFKAQALSSSHFIEQIQDLMSTGEQSKNTAAKTPVKILIGMQDLMEACSETKPSISSGELRKLSAIYGKFVDDRNGNMPNGEASNEIGGRTTLM